MTFGSRDADAAIAIDRNFARAYAEKGSYLVASGRAAEAFELVEQGPAARPAGSVTRTELEWVLCYAQAHLAHWEQAIEAVRKIGRDQPSTFWPYFELAASYAWIGRRDRSRPRRLRTSRG